MTDILTTQAELNGHASAVVVDAAGGGRPSATSLRRAQPARQPARPTDCASLGAHPGERVVWCGPNSLEVVTVPPRRSARPALVSVPLSYRFTAEEMQYVVDNSDATIVVIDAEQAPLLASVRDRLPKVREIVVVRRRRRPTGSCAGTTLLAGDAETEPTARPTPPRSADSMIYTSGTTGHPKGATADEGTDPETVFALLDGAAVPARERGPPHHRTALSLRSADVRHARPLDGREHGRPARSSTRARGCGSLPSTESPTRFSAPTQLKRIVSLPPGELARADMSSMRILVANAAPVPYALKQEVIEKLGDGFLFEIYGSTELGVVTRAAARGPAAQAGLVRQDVRSDRGQDRHATTASRRADGRAG